MEDIIAETINNYLNSKHMINEKIYWGNGDLRIVKNCKQSLINVYDRMIKNGLTKNTFVVEQLGDIINRLNKLVQ